MGCVIGDTRDEYVSTFHHMRIIIIVSHFWMMSAILDFAFDFKPKNNSRTISENIRLFIMNLKIICI